MENIKDKTHSLQKFNNIRKQKKINKQTRCPWCGNVLQSEMPFLTTRFNSMKKCKICGGYSAPIDRMTDILSYLVSLIVVFTFMSLNKKVSNLEIYVVVYFIVLYIWFCFFNNNVPYKRIKGYYEKGRIMPSDWSLKEQVLFYAHIKWNRSKWSIFKFWSSKLLIIIAVDDSNKPISHPVCVRIRKCKTGYELTKIMRAVEFDDKACKRFFIYWGDELVGEGTVVSKFYL